LGLWLARPRNDDTLIGFGAFWFFRDPPELELLYGVADAEVGRGYGREIAGAVVDYGIRQLAMPIVRASTDAAHQRSRQLLEDLGFAFERRATVAGLDTAFYTLTPDRRAADGAP
jgi:ribosomal-protein-alanine N-acetyltransferase